MVDCAIDMLRDRVNAAIAGIRATVALPDEGADVAPVSALNAARAVNFVPRLVAAPAGCLSVLDVAAPSGTTHSFGIS